MTITNTILSSQTIAPGIQRIDVFQPEIAKKARPGQFVLVHLNDRGERVPLTIVDTNEEKNNITLIVQQVGKSTLLINQMKNGEVIQDILGPLGTPTEIARYGTALVIGGGVGTAVAYPVAKALKEAGNTLVGMIGARSKEFIILEPQLKEICDE
ncbi:MAG: sulfide/dihydroorotate dehydrogenase-like FAD/NAD-binding protein, partial [Candidatus Latescibacteria bacterium]|nr:sulfide/dihydroorotate dehydrogenase-like FAD/NAD-binding protein [Candidatus Latescibacterota bacterium]